MAHPRIIQGGLGAGISNWQLAKAVSQTGHLGVVSGTALDSILARRLQLGDLDGQMRRAIGQFPDRDMAQRVLETYYIPGGKMPEAPFKLVPMFTEHPRQSLLELTVVANFVEVFLAKEGHKGLVGINFLEKIQLPNLPSVYGAMLAGVDYVLMGAGIPREIPGVLDALSEHRETSIKINIDHAKDSEHRFSFAPQSIIQTALPPLKRPHFLAIIASVTLALALVKKSTGKIDGFVIETPTAGGHNAPPRGVLHLDENGEPIYGPKDHVDVARIQELGLPFWMAGSYASPEKLASVLQQGASGIQVGTAFAFCRESGLADKIKTDFLAQLQNDAVEVFTDPLASPTGFPFKVVKMTGMIDRERYDARPRICDLGYLRTAYLKPDGALGFRCPSEPEETYRDKGGAPEDTAGRKCLCNALLSNIGLAQCREGFGVEAPLITAGNDIGIIRQFLKNGRTSYSAQEVIQYLSQGNTSNA